MKEQDKKKLEEMLNNISPVSCEYTSVQLVRKLRKGKCITSITPTNSQPPTSAPVKTLAH